MDNKKYIEAARLFKDSAERGNIPEAWHNLGYLISEYNVSLDKNVDKKLQMAIAYKKAAELGYAPSMYNYALAVTSIEKLFIGCKRRRIPVMNRHQKD